MGVNVNLVYILVAFIVAMVAVYVLYAIIIPKGNIKEDKEFQLTTKNILEHVKTLFNQGEYGLVELLAMKYLERMPKHLEVRQYLAEAYYNDKKYNNAIKQCLIILKRDPGNINTKKLLGDCYIKKGVLTKAIREYEEIFDYRSRDPEVVRTLAELYRETEQVYSSISVYNMLVDLVVNNDELANIQSILAELNEEAHDYPAAFEAYKTRLSIYPTDVETNRKLTELYVRINNYPKAIETLLYMLTFVTEPKTLLWIYETIINMYVETEDYQKAIDYSNKLLEVQGADTFKVRTDIAEFNLKLNNYDAGIGILEELVMMSQSAYDVTIELAYAYIQQKEYEKALQQYTTLLDKATQKEAKNIRTLLCELYISWAIDVSEKNELDLAFSYLNKAADYDPLNPEIYFNKALLYFKQKNYNSCVESLSSALEYDKFNKFHIKYLLKMAEAHHELGNFFEEKKALSDLIKIDPKNTEGLYRSGLLYMSQHYTKNAEECFNQVLANEPNFVGAKYNLALIYENNNREKAKELYREVLEEDPSFIEAKTALAELSSADNNA